MKVDITPQSSQWLMGYAARQSTATVDAIEAKLAKCRQTLEKIDPGGTLPKRRKAKNK